MARVLVAEQHAVIREGLKQIVAVTRDIAIVGEASSAQQALDEISRNRYDVVILDTSLPGRNWLDTLKELRSQRPNLPVLLLSAHADEDEAVRAFRAGASGYLTTECAPDELLTALRKVLSGSKYVSNALGERLASDLQRGTEKLPHESLSDREYQVMGLLAAGRTVSEIANEMSLSVKTISTYRSRVLEKLNLKNNVELARYYTRFVDTRTIRCERCGQDNPHVASFCAHCGVALDPAAKPPTPVTSPHITPLEESKKQTSFLRKYRWPVGVLAVAVVAGVIGWLLRLPATPNVSPTEIELKYDDGRPDLNLHADSGGYLVHFSPPSIPFVVNKLKVYGATFPSDKAQFDVQIWDARQNVIYSASHPLTLFPEIAKIQAAQTESKWVEILVPDIEIKSDFYVHVFAGSAVQKGLQIGIDDNAENIHSSLTILTPEGTYKVRDGWGNYMRDGWWANKDNVNWMIRVIAEPKDGKSSELPTVPEAVGTKNDGGAAVPVLLKVVELKYDDWGFDHLISYSSGGYLVEFSPPATPFVVSKIKILGATWPEGRPEFDVQIWDDKQEVLYNSTHQGTLFPLYTGGAKWVEIPVPDVEVKSAFFIHVITNSYATQGIHIGADNSTVNRHSNLTVSVAENTYRIRNDWPWTPPYWFADKNKVNWMIRVIGHSPQ